LRDEDVHVGEAPIAHGEEFCAFKSALDDAVRKAEIRDSVDTTQEAQLLTASVLGIFVMLRAAAPPAAISAAATAATHHVASLKPS
jgi:hypothetical protein